MPLGPANGIMIALVCLAAILAAGRSQMIFPDNRDYLDNPQASFVDNEYDNYQVGHTGGVNSPFTNSIPSEYRDNSVARGLNNFALNLNKALLREQNDNIVLSPLSIAGALALVLLGSLGQTYNEIAAALGVFGDISSSQNVHRELASLIDKLTRKDYSNYQNGRPNIAFGSALFVQDDYPIRQQYESFVESVYKSMVKDVDYKDNPLEAQNIINRWVSDLTNGKIQNILTEPPPTSTRFIIANALYFKGEWEKYFMDGLTQRAPFSIDRHTHQQIMIDMMGNEAFYPYFRSTEQECMILGMPYKGNTTYLYAIKPLENSKKDIRQIVNELTVDSLDSLIKNAKIQKTLISFPKMKLTSSYKLSTVLQNMGIRSVFSNTQANLGLLSSGMTNKQSPHKFEKMVEDDEQFIFTRIEEESDMDPKCANIFKNPNSINANCSTVEMVNNKSVTVVYKKIGDKVGRRIIKRSADDDDDEQENRHIRTSRQANAEAWNPGLYVDEVIHKVDIEITETGTEAAASTGVLITRGGNRPIFFANEPFFFVIRDEETKLILFSAIVFKPTPNY